MNGTDGVRIDQLVCPTCREIYGLPLDVYVENEEEKYHGLLGSILPRSLAAVWRYYVRCPNGHLWTVKQITRSRNQMDEVLLGSYIGDE